MDGRFLLSLVLFSSSITYSMDNTPNKTTKPPLPTKLPASKYGFIDAARHGRLNLLEAYIKAGVDLNQKNKFGDPALILAVMNQHTKVVERLLKAGANPNLVDHDNRTALEHAIRVKNSELIRMLLAAHADPNARAGGLITERTILMVAAESGDPIIVQMLVTAGADTQAKEIGGVRRAINFARGNPEIIRMLAKDDAEVIESLNPLVKHKVKLP